MSQTLDVAYALARHGRVRRSGDDMTVKDVFRQMDRTEAIGLLHDGAGWDALRISRELDMGAREVRLGVARARLRASLSECSPCSDQLDGLMTFSADAVDHSMTCGECKETRRALRAGKLALRDRWRTEAASHRTVTDRPAGVAGRRDHRHKPRPRRAAVHIATTAHPRQDVPPRNRSRGEGGDDEVITPGWTGRAAAPSEDADAGPTELSPRWSPPLARTRSSSDIDQQPRSPAPADRAGAGDAAPDLEIPDREPLQSPTDLIPTGPRPTGPMVSLPDRTPDRRHVTPLGREKAAAPTTAPSTGRPSRLGQVGLTVLASITAVASRLRPGLSGRRVLTLFGILAIAGLAAVVVDTTRSASTAAEEAVLAENAVSGSQEFSGSTADVAQDGEQDGALTVPDEVVAEPTGIVATPEPPPSNPNDPTLATWQELSRCEASGDWGMNSGNGFYGGLQFTVESWRLVGGTGLPHEAPALEQIRRAERLLDLQGWVAWPVCSVRLGLRTPEPGEVLHPAAVPQGDPGATPLPGSAAAPLEP